MRGAQLKDLAKEFCTITNLIPLGMGRAEMMTSEEIYDLVAYFMKEDAGLPCRYDELSFEQRSFVDALVENFESDAEETISKWVNMEEAKVPTDGSIDISDNYYRLNK